MAMKADVIHGLRFGFALCGFSQKPPKDWPDGHKWVRFDQLRDITCPDCEKEAIGVAIEEKPV